MVCRFIASWTKRVSLFFIIKLNSKAFLSCRKRTFFESLRCCYNARWIINMEQQRNINTDCIIVSLISVGDGSVILNKVFHPATPTKIEDE